MLCLAIIGSFAIFAAGCEKHTRYKVLTFFFTGVPPITGGQHLGTAAGSVKEERTKRRVKQSIVFMHGPKASNQCYYCHNTASSKSFRAIETGSSMPRLGEIKPGRLVLPIKELCIQCHVTKSTDVAYVGDLWLHGPLADGNCVICHDYHETKYKYMLYTERTNELCGRCHADGFLGSSEEHKRGSECTECHNPHLGANRLLLKKDYNEIF